MATSTTSTPALDRLRHWEQAELLPELLATHPESVETLEARALARIRDLDADEVESRCPGWILQADGLQ